MTQTALQLGYYLLVHPFIRFFIRSEVRIEADLSMTRGPLVIAANHENRFDPFFLALLPWRLVRRIVPLAFPTGAYFDSNRLLWFVLRTFGAYRIPRYAWSLDEYLETTAERIRSGRSIMIFPEGRVVREPGAVKVRSGVGLLATRTRAAVLPMFLTGTGELTLRRILTRRAEVKLRVGEPMRFTVTDDPSEVAGEILSSIYRLRDR